MDLSFTNLPSGSVITAANSKFILLLISMATPLFLSCNKMKMCEENVDKCVHRCFGPMSPQCRKTMFAI